MSEFRVRTAAVTHLGHVRSANEDALVVLPELSIWAVADGMGGLSHGSWASNQIVSALQNLRVSGEFEQDIERIGDAVREANSKIVAASEAVGRQMGTTVVALHIAGSRFAVLWVGDSRAYLFRDNMLYRLTRDHTQVQEMVDAGILSPEDAVHHPASHVLSRAVGVEPQVVLEAVTDAIQQRDVFLLCSDGLTGVVSDAEIDDRLRRLEPELATQNLLELALSRGGPDNVTIIVVGCEERTRLDLAGGVPEHA
jgi:serine/threonine protein phosphatase PrpC